MNTLHTYFLFSICISFYITCFQFAQIKNLICGYSWLVRILHCDQIEKIHLIAFSKKKIVTDISVSSSSKAIISSAALRNRRRVGKL